MILLDSDVMTNLPRRSGVLLLLLAVSLLLAGCGRKAAERQPSPTETPTRPAATATPAPTATPRPTATPTRPTATPTTEPAWLCPPATAALTIWHFWSEQELKAATAIFDEYQVTCPQITLELVSKPELDGIAPEVLLGEAGPDIITQRSEELGRLAEQQAIVSLTPYLEPVFANNYTSQAVAGVSYKGQVYGYPESLETITLIFNRDLISEEELPKDTDELLRKAAAWKKTDYYLVYSARNDAYFSAPWWQAAGVTILDDEGHTTFQSSAGYTAGNFLDALRGLMPDNVDYALADRLFQAGQAAMTINGPWYMAELEQADIHYGLHLLPVFSPTGIPAMPFVRVRYLALTRNALDRGTAEAALNVMRYYTRAEAQIRLAKTAGMIPAHVTAAADPGVTALPVVSAFSAQAALGKALPTSPFLGAMWDPIAQGLECIWTGAAPVTTCVDRIQAAAEESIQRLK